MPASHDGGGGRCIAKAERPQRFQGAGIVVDAGEDQVATRAGKARRLFEQAGIVALDAAQALEQRLLERRGVRVSEEGGDGGDACFIVRHAVRLLVVDHLQAVLDPAQESVGFYHLVGGLRADMAGERQCAQCRASGAQPQRGIPTAEDQLLGLGKELDFADTTAAQLHIVSEHLHRAAAAMGVDLPFDRMDVVDGGEVEMLAPDIGPQVGQEGLADCAIAGHGMGLDHGCPLPVLADALVVEFGRLHRHRERRRAGVGAQPQVGTEDIAVARYLRHELHQ